MKELHRLTDLQITLLHTIWRRGEATVREVYEAQEQTLGLALKTVGTVLRRLERQEILAHREEGREFVYRARVSRDDVRQAAIRATADNLFSGSVEELVRHALGDGGEGEDGRAAIRRSLNLPDG